MADADDLLNRLDSIDTVDAAATWAAQACMEIATLRAAMQAVSSIEHDWQQGFERSDASMERISAVILRGGKEQRRH